jgi:hypothetical protein
MPAFCGENKFEHMLHLFVKMIRHKTPDSIADFYDFLRFMYSECPNEDFKSEIATLIATESIIDSVMEAANITSLDPAPTFFINHCDSWGRHFNAEFDVIHDKSKPMEYEKEILEYLMDKTHKEIEIGYDRRKMMFPLKATGIKFVDSKLYPQLQIADILAGACAYWAGDIVKEPADKSFLGKLNAIDFQKLVINVLWPNPEVDPKSLGTSHEGGINAVNYLSEVVSKHQAKKN